MKKKLNINGAVLDKYQLEKYLEKIASDHVLQNKSDKETYPIDRLNENYIIIKEVYKLLNEHIKLGIPIHPAGEWILDNLYIIEETVKNISKELTIKKYQNFLGIANGRYQGYARIYVLAAEMVAYTDGKIDDKNLKEMLMSYQNKKTLSMNEIWNIGIFIQIALIENIREISQRIYLSQIQKYKVENIIERLIDKKDKQKFKQNPIRKIEIAKSRQIKNSFIEYMSYKLRKYGRKATPYFNILEEEVNKSGNTISEIIKKEHFDIAVKKVSIGNCIISLKTISRLSFLEIFENLNGVEDILKKDPFGQYDKMTIDTKILYRNTIEEISKKTKLSEIYIANKCLELSQRKFTKNNELNRKNHIGYYLISKGKIELLNILLNKNKRLITENKKTYIYISVIWGITAIISLLLTCKLNIQIEKNILNIVISIIMFIIIILPVENIVSKIVQYILSKIIKPKEIAKLDFQDGVPEEYATFVVIPTILKNKEKVKELCEKLEVFYIANKSNNIYFALLGDCSSSTKEIEDFDNEIIETGISQIKKLNEKYIDFKYPKFNFIYRKRIWNDKEKYFLGWERKRGLLNQFNEYILGKEENQFKINTMEEYNKQIPKFKYIITLDADTDLVLNSGIELIGAMAHILNKPILNQNKDLVISGHGIIAPRMGISLRNSRQSIFTQIYGGQGGTDSYTSAISDMYQDNFDEGIFTGKGIYDLDIFSTVLNNEIKENTVLSHDLLEGCYLRCGMASDIMLMDGFPRSYLSFKERLYRWIRGDYQILLWLKNKIEDKNKKIKNNPLNILSKYKILNNIFRSKLETAIVLLIFYSLILAFTLKIDISRFLVVSIISISIPTILDILGLIIGKKENIIKTKTFTKTITGVKSSILRAILDFSVIPDKAFMSIKAEIKTLNRMIRTKEHLLEWVTSEETEKISKSDCFSYYKVMLANIICGLLGVLFSVYFIRVKVYISIYLGIISILWILAPLIMCKISKKNKIKKQIENINEKDRYYLNDIGYKTWLYFKENIGEKNNYLPPDNYQEDRKPKLIERTSSTNIGLALLATISAYDIKYESLENTINLLNKMINTIVNLPKWNGHLYNWYDLKNLEPLIPRYISSVDSGNFVGYLYVIRQFLKEAKEKIENIKRQKNKEVEKIDRSIITERNIGTQETILKIDSMINIIEDIIKNTDFSKLYNEKNRLFSVGFNIEENKLTDSYYDLLASEARQTSLVAIAKKDVSPKHWNNLSRTLTKLNNYKGLISWSGTAFEYLMPNINIPKYEGSILDESCKFMIMSQKEYAKKLGVPWGFSEAAFNLRDLNNNYQYKAFGIPWLGLKRGLADEIVVSSYGTILAIEDDIKGVVENIRELEKQGMYNKYGFYESIDYTPSRVKNSKAIVKTYMAHHQSLILLSINNLFNDKIIQKRFMKNPEMQAIRILLEEKMPENMIVTKEEKEKVEKIKYVDYENYNQRVYNKIEEDLNISNIISNDKYTVIIDQYGNGYSKYEDIQINRYKETDDEIQGIFFYIKDIKNKRVWTNTYSKYLSKPDKYSITFSPDMNKIIRIDGAIKTVTKIITDTEEPVEIRRIELTNIGLNEQLLEITAFLEPILSNKMQDYSHKAFNNLFLSFEYIEKISTILVKRRSHTDKEQDIYMAIKLYTQDNNGDIEFEIDKERFAGRCNINLPKSVENSMPFSRKIEHVTDQIIALKKVISIKENEKVNIDLILSVSKSKEEAVKNIITFMNNETINRTFEVSRARVEAEMRYLGIKGTDMETYQRLLPYLIFTSKGTIKNLNTNLNMIYPISGLWKYGISGDLPILLVEIKNINDIDIIKEIINAYEFYKSKNIQIDLIILNEEKEAYENYVKDEIQSIILNKGLGYLFNVKGGIFCLNNIINKKDKELLKEKANVFINAEEGNLKEHIDCIEEKIKESIKQTGYDNKKEYIIEEKTVSNNNILNEDILKYYNEYGGFSQDGKEYLIKINKNNKLPTVWSNILTNKEFGTLTTENMGGYTWSKNSRLNKLTSWDNNQIADIPSEIIYIKDMDTDQKWSLGLNPMPDDNDYYITYGFGYSKYFHFSSGIKQTLDIFIPNNDNVKINILHLENTNVESKNLKIIYYIKPVLDEDEIKSNGKISLEFNKKSNIIFAKNIANENIKEQIFISSSEKIESYTGNKNSFLKESTISNPSGLDQIELSRENSYGRDGIIAISIKIKLEAMSNKDISLIFGAEEGNIKCQDIAYKYTNINNCKEEYIKTKKYWENLLSNTHVNTPVESINILLNGWLMYQVITSRLLAKTGYYQSGGAFGFRDQLQDVMSVKYIDPQVTRQQIIKHSKHQFIEGDVEHWWHEETSRGIRTRFSDDLLWLPYVTADYIEFTVDYTILKEQTSYKKGDNLKELENEKYELYKNSEKIESIYEHCIRAIEKSLNFGENGLPKIGSGDWNDGFNTVGIYGKGESVWLGFFLYDVLRKFIPICNYMGDQEKVKKYTDIMEKLKKDINTNGWDGRWYKRAFTDNGDILGSLQNEECKIDSISQSWSVISNAGDNDKKYISMESLENHLVDREDGIIKLLDPPFEKSRLEPGYIKSYIPGTRENGGQYTHGAIWVIIATAILGLNEKAFEYFKMVNPIEHSRTKEAANKYKVEPYVIAADVYGKGNLAGRGGWTWYTGSASWMYIAGIKYILGINIENEKLTITPHVPNEWGGYTVQFKYGKSIYNIKVNKIKEDNKIILVNGIKLENKNNEIILKKDGGIYNIEVN